MPERTYLLGSHSPSHWEDIGPMTIPTVATDVATETRYICSMTIANHTGADVTVKILDKQATPLGLFGRSAAGSVVTAGTTQRWEWKPAENGSFSNPTSYPMVGGMTWEASAAGVVAHIVWEW